MQFVLEQSGTAYSAYYLKMGIYDYLRGATPQGVTLSNYMQRILITCERCIWPEGYAPSPPYPPPPTTGRRLQAAAAPSPPPDPDHTITLTIVILADDQAQADLIDQLMTALLSDVSTAAVKLNLMGPLTTAAVTATGQCTLEGGSCLGLGAPDGGGGGGSAVPMVLALVGAGFFAVIAGFVARRLFCRSGHATMLLREHHGGVAMQDHNKKSVRYPGMGDVGRTDQLAVVHGLHTQHAQI